MSKIKSELFELIGDIVGVSLFFVPTLDIKSVIILSLSGSAIFLCIRMWKLSRQYKALEKDYKQIRQKHRALASLFDEKQQTIKEYEHAAQAIERLLDVAILNSKALKIKSLHEAIMLHLKNIT